MAADGAAGRKLVVLGIPYNVDTDELREYMEQFGKLEDCIVLKDRGTGRSRGFGYVTFATLDDVQTVLQADHSLGGRHLDIKPATPKEHMGGGRAAGRSSEGERERGAGNDAAGSTRIFVARIPNALTEEKFKEYFSAFGAVTDAYMPKNPGTSQHRGIGFVTFENAACVDKVLSEARDIDGIPLAIDRAAPKEDGSHGGRSSSGSSQRYPHSRGGARGGGGAAAYGLSPFLPYDHLLASSPAAAYGAYAAMAHAGLSPREAMPYMGQYPLGYGGAAAGYGMPGRGGAGGGGGGGGGSSAGGGGGGGSGSSGPVHPTKVFVAKLPPEATVAELREYFSRFGPVEDVFMPKDAAKSGHRGFAFVSFEEEEVAAFVAKRSHTVAGRQVVVERATPQAGEPTLTAAPYPPSFFPPHHDPSYAASGALTSDYEQQQQQQQQQHQALAGVGRGSAATAAAAAQSFYSSLQPPPAAQPSSQASVLHSLGEGGAAYGSGGQTDYGPPGHSPPLHPPPHSHPYGPQGGARADARFRPY